jgi:tight adherence protein C
MISTSLFAGALTVVSLVASVLFVMMPRLSARIWARRVIRMQAEGSNGRASGEPESAMRPLYALLEARFGRLDLSGQNFNRRVQLIRRFRRAGLAQGRVNVFVLSKFLSPVVLAAAAWVICDSLYGFATWKASAIAAAAAALGYWAPDVWLTNRIERRQMRIDRRWSDALDLLHMCVRSGMSLEAALTKAAREMRGSAPDIADEFVLTVTELNYLQSRSAALENLADRTGLSSVRAVVTALIQSQKYGSSIAGTLQTMARQNRAKRFGEAEKKAASLPPRLTVPMIIFFLPALFAVIIAPAIINLAG